MSSILNGILWAMTCNAAIYSKTLTFHIYLTTLKPHFSKYDPDSISHISKYIKTTVSQSTILAVFHIYLSTSKQNFSKYDPGRTMLAEPQLQSSRVSVIPDSSVDSGVESGSNFSSGSVLQDCSTQVHCTSCSERYNQLGRLPK